MGGEGASEEGAAEAVGSCDSPLTVEGRTTAALFAGRLPGAGGGEEGEGEGARRQRRQKKAVGSCDRPLAGEGRTTAALLAAGRLLEAGEGGAGAGQRSSRLRVGPRAVWRASWLARKVSALESKDRLHERS